MKAERSGRLYEFAGHRLDVARRTLECGGQTVALYPRSFDALVMLVEQRGALLAKETLFSQLWPGVVVEENSLARVISDIRKALGDAAECVVTVPRRGYRLAAEVTESEREPAVGQTAARIRTLAVLPFATVGGDNEDKLLAFGMADALITRLSNVGGMIVRPTSSVARYAEGPPSPVIAGRELQVDAVLSGGIRRSGGQIRVTVQLIDVSNEATLWANQFDEAAADFFAIEDSISERVAAALAIELTRDERKSLSQRHTRNSEAYAMYLRGRFWSVRRTRHTLEKAAECLRTAVQLEPNFALAHATLAETYLFMAIAGTTADAAPARQMIPLARAAAQRAVAIDDRLGEAHAVLGSIAFFFDWNWPAAEAAFRHAIQLNPTAWTSHQFYAMALSSVGRCDEALLEIRRASELEPTSMVIGANIGFILCRAGRIQEAIESLERCVSLEPGHPYCRHRYGLALEVAGRYAEALPQYELAIQLGMEQAGLAAKAHLLALMGRRSEAEQGLQQLFEVARQRFVTAYFFAEIYAGLGDADQAVAWLEKAFEERPNLLAGLQVARSWDGLRQDPRFQSVVKRIGLWG